MTLQIPTVPFGTEFWKHVVENCFSNSRPQKSHWWQRVRNISVCFLPSALPNLYSAFNFNYFNSMMIYDSYLTSPQPTPAGEVQLYHLKSLGHFFFDSFCLYCVILCVAQARWFHWGLWWHHPAQMHQGPPFGLAIQHQGTYAPMTIGFVLSTLSIPIAAVLLWITLWHILWHIVGSLPSALKQELPNVSVRVGIHVHR